MKQDIPAFPNMAPNSCGPHIAKRDGMTLRDYFAGQALPALVEAANAHEKHLIAPAAYRIAESMLAEREKSRD